MASFHVYSKNIPQVFLKGNTMTDTPIVVPVSASGDAKPSTPATPQQQTQTNPPKPADKPSEQQK
jgi:hypothetical protein